VSSRIDDALRRCALGSVGVSQNKYPASADPITLAASAPRSTYDVAPDGRFLATSLVLDAAAAQPVTILLNWPMLLKK
jgi:hypothetical protein